MVDAHQTRKFNVYFKAFLEFLKTSGIDDGSKLSELDSMFTTMNVVQPGKVRQLFDSLIRQPYGDRIFLCDVTVVDDLHSQGNDLFDVHGLWNSPGFDELKKAHCFRHLIQICKTYD